MLFHLGELKQRKVLGSSTGLSLAESTVTYWVGVLLHAEMTAVLLILSGDQQWDHC